MNDKIFYVYAYLDPRIKGSFQYGEYKFDYEPFYIGKGKDNRMYDHLKYKSENTSKVEFIEEIIKDGYNPVIIKVFEYLEEKESFELEKDLIMVIGQRMIGTGPLTNIQQGGQGFSGWIPTENWLLKNKEAQKKRWNNPEERFKHSKIMKEVGSRPSFRKKCKETAKKFWKVERNRMISYQKRPDVKKKKSVATINSLSQTWIVINPSGKRFETNRLKEFCKEFGLSVEPLQRVAMGKNLNHKGWLCFKPGKEQETRKLLKQLKLDKEKREVERRKKLRISSTGRKKSEEEKRKIGESSLGNTYGLGVKHSDETKRKIGEASKKRWKDSKFREKVKKSRRFNQ
ncbi:hypothetical protein KAR91_62685 [Candidatus Pacearchaeota archaeon]|nr:hypothetical protein [Candidatus Pacearchaeota archaeon]